MNSIWFWGQSHHATSRILVYNVDSKYIGNYLLSIVSDLPSYIQKNRLVFMNGISNNDCNPKSITYIEFDSGIPHSFFRKCNGNTGDIYTFDKSE
jgi:hypothetical protein